MAIYNIEIAYRVATNIQVEANDEGEALEKARTSAEECDMAEFVPTNELESRVISTN